MERILSMMRHGLYDKATGNLTANGQQNTTNVAQQMAHDDLIPDLILHSHYPRTAQTARRVQEAFAALGKKPELMEAAWLAEDKVTMPKCLTEIADGKRVVLLVTHIPNIAILTDEFRLSQCPDYSGACAFKQDTANWQGFTAPKLIKAWRPA